MNMLVYIYVSSFFKNVHVEVNINVFCKKILIIIKVCVQRSPVLNTVLMSYNNGIIKVMLMFEHHTNKTTQKTMKLQKS